MTFSRPLSPSLALAALLFTGLAVGPIRAQQTFTVTTNADSGEGSLRAAIASANATPERDVIAFAIDGGGSFQQITLASTLEVTAPIALDGNSQGCDTSQGLCIRLDGGATRGDYSGLFLTGTSEGSEVRGLVVTRFGTDTGTFGIGTDTGGHVIAGNYVGTDRTGQIIDPDGMAGSGDELGNLTGISLMTKGDGTAVSGTLIGGVDDGNVVSGNIRTAVFSKGVDRTDTRIIGNRIGAGADGTTVLGNGDLSNGSLGSNGISISGHGSGLVIGGSEDGEGNVIVGSRSPGGGGAGILLSNTDGATVAGNVISGNAFGGIAVQEDANRNVVRSNLIGLAPDGNTALPNGTLAGLPSFEGFGIAMVSGATENVVTDNYISGNLLGGVLLGGSAAGDITDNRIEGNVFGIGTDDETVVPNGIAGVPDVGVGVAIVGQAVRVTGNVVSGNVIGGNTTAGVLLDGQFATNNVITDNRIGLNPNEDPAANGQAGIVIRTGANGNTIGGPTDADVNLIVANPVSIAFANDAGVGNSVAGNIMGASLFNIDLNSDGVTVNDDGDADDGPNRQQNRPVIASARVIGGTAIQATFSVDTAPANATYPLTLQLYSVTQQEGLTVLVPLETTLTYTSAEAQTVVTKSATLTEEDLDLDFDLTVLLAAVTDADGNTSETTFLPLTITSNGDDADALALSLAPNAPNPFGSTTQITYTTDESGPVALDVFDLLGRHVATLVDDVQPAGTRTVAFDASHLPTGTYAYRLRTASGTMTRTLTVLR